MTIAEWLSITMKNLGEVEVDSPRRDALVLLEDTLGKDRSWVLAHPEYNVQGQALEIVNTLVERRMNREPLAYIRGKAWFYGRFFEVNTSVMIPRPESESFIKLLKQLDPKTIIDIGTGSGCLAVTAKLELPNASVIAVDTSQQALRVADKNAKGHKTEIKFLNGSLLQPIASASWRQSTALIANLPYVPDGLVTSPEIMHEPRQALFSGIDGLDHYRMLWEKLAELPKKPFIVLAESLLNQHATQTILAESSGYKLQETDLLVQQFQLD